MIYTYAQRSHTLAWRTQSEHPPCWRVASRLRVPLAVLRAYVCTVEIPVTVAKSLPSQGPRGYRSDTNVQAHKSLPRGRGCCQVPAPVPASRHIGALHSTHDITDRSKSALELGAALARRICAKLTMGTKPPLPRSGRGARCIAARHRWRHLPKSSGHRAHHARKSWGVLPLVSGKPVRCRSCSPLSAPARYRGISLAHTCSPCIPVLASRHSHFPSHPTACARSRTL